MMSNPRPMFATAILNTAMKMVPHWFEAGPGYVLKQISVLRGDDPPIKAQQDYRTTRDFGKQDQDIHDIVHGELERVLRSREALGANESSSYSRLDLEAFAQRVALQWLLSRDASVQWDRLLDYAHVLRERTYENDPVVFNAILALSEEIGIFDLTTDDDEVQKKIDPLGASLNTLFVLDTESRVLRYEQVPTEHVEKRVHFAHPSVLAPITSRLGAGDFSFHRIRRGDILINDDSGLVATRRKGRWYIYDMNALYDTLIDIFGVSGERGESFVQHLLDVVFDLSYRRHGALLVFDPEAKVRNRLYNPDTVFDNAKEGSPHKVLNSSLNRFSLANGDELRNKRHLLLEAASLDGAVIFDLDSVVSCGSFVEPAQNVQSGAGTRTTAAKSAFIHGGIPIKISADGNITIFFGQDKTLKQPAELHFA